MDHRALRRELTARVESVLGATDLPYTLRDYQTESLERLRDWLADPSGTPRGYFAHATGLGKTILFAALLRQCVGLRVLVIEPTKVLVEQTARVMVRFTGGMIGHLASFPLIKDDRGEVISIRGHQHTSIVITTDESFLRYAARLAQEFKPHLIIWDECHWAYVKPAKAALAMFDQAVIIGLSATPDYLTNAAKGGYVPVKMDNGQTLYAPPDRLARTHFQTLLDERSIRWGIETGWLAPLAWARIKFDAALEKLPLVEGFSGLDYEEAALAEMMAEHWSVIVEAVCRLYEEDGYNLAERQVFAVCPSVGTAKRLAEAISSLGVPAAHIVGTTNDRDRNLILQAFREGEFKLLSSVMVLREGWDAPNAEVCLMLRLTRSRVVYIQNIGRILRPDLAGGYKVALVVDAHPRDRKLQPLSAPLLFAPPGSEVAERAILVGPKRRPAHINRESTLTSPYLPQGVKPQIVIVEETPTEYWAGTDGTFTADGEVWGTPAAFALILPVSGLTLKKRLREAKKEGQVHWREGRTARGIMSVFYALSDAQIICADLIGAEKISAAAWFEANGEVWTTKSAAVGLLRTSLDTVDWLIRTPSVRSRLGKPKRGMPTKYYCLSDLRRAYEGLRQGRNVI